MVEQGLSFHRRRHLIEYGAERAHVAGDSVLRDVLLLQPQLVAFYQMRVDAVNVDVPTHIATEGAHGSTIVVDGAFSSDALCRQDDLGGFLDETVINDGRLFLSAVQLVVPKQAKT